jgi:hypothetical protein
MTKRGMLGTPIGQAERIHNTNKEFLQIFFICCALPISRVKFAVPIVLALHKGHKRIGKVGTPICRALPIVLEIAN